jgi:pyruvate/2-oxoglutarate dehydrogenase complex dihydrolipoamide acyltransferase (E2) component
MPQMGVSVAEGTIIAWSKRIGDPIDLEEPICEITTDKVDTEVPAPAAGTLAEILVEAGETVDVGTILARILPTGSPVPAPSSPTGNATAAAVQAAVSAEPGHPQAADPPMNRFHSPVARRIAAEHGVDLARIAGSGRNDRVTKADVLAFIASHGSGDAAGAKDGAVLHSDSPYRADADPTPPDTPPSDLGGRTEHLSRMRLSIGAAMRHSLELAATCTTVVECDMSRVEESRRALGITALPLVAVAAIEMLRTFPRLNATLDVERLTVYDRVHLGVAVSLGEDGLIVPVIHDAQTLAVEDLAHRIRDVAKRARAKSLVADDVRGATFTITNPGAFGALIATPIINVPQVAILDLEAIVRRPVVVTDADGNDAIAIRPVVNLCMSWDHRAVDGAYAARFLTALRKRLESGTKS